MRTTNFLAWLVLFVVINSIAPAGTGGGGGGDCQPDQCPGGGIQYLVGGPFELTKELYPGKDNRVPVECVALSEEAAKLKALNVFLEKWDAWYHDSDRVRVVNAICDDGECSTQEYYEDTNYEAELWTVRMYMGGDNCFRVTQWPQWHIPNTYNITIEVDDFIYLDPDSCDPSIGLSMVDDGCATVAVQVKVVDGGNDNNCPCCEAFRNSGLMLPGQGLIVCCGQQGPFACIMPGGPDDDCTNAHEQHHKQNHPSVCLGSGSGVQGSIYQGEKSMDERECEATAAEIECLLGKGKRMEAYATAIWANQNLQCQFIPPEY